MNSVCFQGKPFNITVIQVYAPTINAKEAEVTWFYENPKHLLELIFKKKKKKRCPFHHVCEVAQSCPTLCDPMDCSPPGSSVHGILQARIVEWVVISYDEKDIFYLGY